MNNNNQKLPKFRFSGFYNYWSEEELGEISIFNPPSELPDIFEYIDLESVQGTTILNHRTENKKTAPSRAQRLAQWGDIFYQTVRPYQKNNCLYELPYDNYVFSTGYAQIRTNLDKYFLFTYIQNEVFVSKVLERSTGTSYPSINTKDLSKIKIFFPGSYEEQEKIGLFFNKLDKTITQQQQLLDNHKQLKKAMLQKMFPKKGETVPRVRFAEFNNEWTQKKLGEIYEKSSYRNKDLEYGKEKIISVSKMRFKNTISKSNDDYMKTYNILKRDEIAFEGNKSKNYKYGRFVLNDIGDGIVSHVFIVMKPKVILPSNFIKEYINNENIMQKILLFSTTSTLMMTSLNSKEFLKQKIRLPSFKEQEKIGNFFKQLDETIVLYEQKLETYQNLKKAMLQKMFV